MRDGGASLAHGRDPPQKTESARTCMVIVHIIVLMCPLFKVSAAHYAARSPDRSIRSCVMGGCGHRLPRASQLQCVTCRRSGKTYPRSGALSPVSTYCAGVVEKEELDHFEKLRTRNRELREQLGLTGAQCGGCRRRPYQDVFVTHVRACSSQTCPLAGSPCQDVFVAHAAGPVACSS